MEQNNTFLFKAFIKKRKIDLVLLVLGIFLGIFFDWETVEIVIFLTFLWSILGPIPSRWLAGPALFFLSFVPILLTLKREDQAEEFAVYAYYFLAMAVIRGIIEVRNEKNDDKPAETP